MTHRKQDKADIKAFQEASHNLPQVVGMGHHDDGIRRLGEEIDKVAAVSGEIHDSDCSGWDMSVQRQWVMWDAARRIMNGPRCRVYRELVHCEACATTAHVVAVGRDLYSVNKAGITASGIPSTAAQNSYARAAVKKLAGAEEVRTLGDDEFNSGANIWIEKFFGANMKGEPHHCGPDGPFSFTSHEFRRVDGVWTARFQNLDKMLARIELTCKKGETWDEPDVVNPDVLGGCLYVLRHDPVATEQFRGVCAAMGWSLEGVVPHYADGTDF